MSHTQTLPNMIIRRLPHILGGFVASVILAGSGYAQQVVYYSPVVAQPAPYVSQYTPSGTYSAVTAYSAPVAAVPASSVAVTSYYAPAPTAYYAPAATTSYYTPTTAYYAPTAAYYAPTAAYYAPTAYYAPYYYRRGLFGRYRPARGMVYPAY